MLPTRIMKRHQRKFEDSELLQLLDEEDTQMLKQLAVTHMFTLVCMLWKTSRRKGRVPHKLPDGKQDQRRTISEILTERCHRKSFLRRIVTCEETRNGCIWTIAKPKKS